MVQSCSRTALYLHLSQGLPQVLRYSVGRHPHGFRSEMRIARGCLDLRVPEELADHGQALAGRDGGRCKRMAQVVDPDILHPCSGTHPLPEWLQVTERLAGQGAGDDPRVAIGALGILQQVHDRLANVNDLRTGFGIRQAQGRAVEIDVGPLQGHDFVQTAPGQDQHPRCENSRSEFHTFSFHLAQHFADPAQLGRTEEAFALFLGVLPDVLARVGPVRTQAPHLGEAEHLRDHLEAAVGLIGDVAQVVVELRDIGPRDPRDRQLPESGKDEALQVPSILFAGAGLHADGNVFLVEPLGQFLDCDGLATGVAFGRRVLSVARSGDDGDGAGACLFTGQHGAGTEADPPRPATRAVLHDVAFPTAWQHPKSEAGDVAVPDKVFGGLDVCGVDDALCQFGHGSSFQVVWLPQCAMRGASQRTH